MKQYHPTIDSYKQGAKTLPGNYYNSVEIFQKEQENIFAKNWNCVGLSSTLTKPGDYFLANVAGESLIIIRDSFGKFHAHFNVCRHRGTRISVEPSGHFLKHMQCSYHAWTYGTDGKLVTAPHMYEAKDFDKDQYGLIPASVIEWEGFLFVNIDPKSKPFHTVMKPYLDLLSHFDLSKLQVGHKVVYDVAANWKLLFQNYNECLHCPTMHPQLAVTLPFTSTTNDLTEGPFLGGPMEIRLPNKSATMDGTACGRLISDRIPAKDIQRAYYYTLMPNLFVSIHPDYANYYLIHPIDVGHTQVVSEWLFHPDTIVDKHNNMKGAIEFWDLTNRQDWAIVERNQLGVQSRAYVPGPYSPRESIPAAWDREYLRLMKHKPK